MSQRVFINRPRYAPKRRDHTAFAWLGNDTKSSGVLETARRHLAIQTAVATALPRPLADVCKVSKLDNQRLTVAVPSAAHAAKLRQLGPSIAAALAEKGWAVNEVEVRVLASLQLLQAYRRPAPKEAVPLDNTALDAFQTLQSNVRPGPLADAIARLLAHHREK